MILYVFLDFSKFVFFEYVYDLYSLCPEMTVQSMQFVCRRSVELALKSPLISEEIT